MSGPAKLESMVSNFYKDLFTKDVECKPFYLIGTFPWLSNKSVQEVGKMVTWEEVCAIIFLMGALKAPVPDGFHVMFYQSQWSVVGQALTNLVTGVFEDPKRVGEINNTLISNS